MGVGAHQLLHHAQVVRIHVLEGESLPLSLSLSLSLSLGRGLWIQPLSVAIVAVVVVDVVGKKSYCPRETRKMTVDVLVAFKGERVIIRVLDGG